MTLTLQQVQDIELGMCILCGVSALISMVLTIFVFLVYFRTQKRIRSIKWSILSMVMFFLTSAGLPFYYSILLPSPYLTISLLLCWTFGTIFVYILFLKRFQKTFENTKYDTLTSKKYKIYIFYTLCVIFIILDIISKILYILPENLVTDYEFNLYTLIISIIEQIIDLILSIGLIGLFVNKLRCLHDDIEYSKRVSIRANNQQQYEQSQFKILIIISKVTLLSTIAIISSQLYLLYKTIFYILESFYGFDVSNIDIWIFDGFLPISSALNTICIFLSFDFNHKWYVKVCCHNKWTKLLQRKQAKKSENRLEMRLLEDSIN